MVAPKWSPKNVLTCETADRRADGTRLRGQRRYWGSPSQENPILSSDHFHWGKQLLTKSLLGLLVSAEVGQAVRMMFHILKLFGSMSQSWGFCVGRELLLSILKLIFTWTALVQPGKNIDDVMCTGTMSNNKTQCQPCKTGWANYSSFLVLVLVIFAIHAYLIFVTNPTNMFV